MKNIGQQFEDVVTLTSPSDLVSTKLLQDERLNNELNSIFGKTSFENFEGFISSKFATRCLKDMKSEALDRILLLDCEDKALYDIGHNAVVYDEDKNAIVSLYITPDCMNACVENKNNRYEISSFANYDSMTIKQTSKDNVITTNRYMMDGDSPICFTSIEKHMNM